MIMDQLMRLSVKSPKLQKVSLEHHCQLSINAKKTVYNVVVISILLHIYVAIKGPDVCIPVTFHNPCVYTIYGVTRYSQRKECVTIADCLLDVLPTSLQLQNLIEFSYLLKLSIPEITHAIRH